MFDMTIYRFVWYLCIGLITASVLCKHAARVEHTCRDQTNLVQVTSAQWPGMQTAHVPNP